MTAEIEAGGRVEVVTVQEMREYVEKYTQGKISSAALATAFAIARTERLIIVRPDVAGYLRLTGMTSFQWSTR